jgi:hypothetical protein
MVQKLQRLIRSGLIVPILMALLPLTALAAPPMPSSYWGQVTIDGVSVAAGTTVEAHVGNQVCGTTTTQSYADD